MILVIISYSFQITGAILLLLNNVIGINNRIISLSIPKTEIPIFNKNKYTVSKDELRKNAIYIYKTICSIIYILIGYTASVFVIDYERKTEIVVFIFVVSILLTIIGMLIPKIIAYTKYKNDISFTYEEIKDKVKMIFSSDD